MSRAIDLLEHLQESVCVTHVLKLMGTADGLAVAVHAEPAEQTLQHRSDCDRFTFCIPVMPLLCPGPDVHDDHAVCVHSLT